METYTATATVRCNMSTMWLNISKHAGIPSTKYMIMDVEKSKVSNLPIILPIQFIILWIQKNLK